MKFLRTAFLALCMLGCGTAAASFSDRHFNQDHMLTLTGYPYNSIIVLSAFDDNDHITAYSDYGSLLWDVQFNTKIISWQLKDDNLYVFGKSRYLEKSYLYCVDPVTGRIRWERP